MAISEIRQRIIDIALGESDQGNPPYGTVTDRIPNPLNRNERYGWDSLKEYFDIGVLNWGAAQWSDPTKRIFKLNDKEFRLTNIEGIRLRGMRVPQGSNGLGVQWCGIFATWVLFRAFAGGVVVQWNMGVGMVGPAVTRINGNKGIQVGDVCVNQGALVHHFIPYEINTQTGIMQAVNGNSDWQSILRKPLPINNVAYYYKVEAD